MFDVYNYKNETHITGQNNKSVFTVKLNLKLEKLYWIRTKLKRNLETQLKLKLN